MLHLFYMTIIIVEEKMKEIKGWTKGKERK